MTYVWSTNFVDTATLASSVETSLDGLRSWSTVFGQTTQSQTVYGANGLRTNTVTAHDGTSVVSVYQFGRLQSVTRKDSTGT